MPTTLNPDQIIDLIQNDPEFAINFIIDNNPSAVESNISSLSIALPQNPSNLQLREVIDDLLNDSENEDAPSTIDEILDVPYLESVDGYTGNLTDELQELGEANGTIIDNPNATGGLIVGAIAGILGAVGQVWGGILNNKALALQQQIINDEQEHELDMLEKTKVFGIPQTIVLAILGFFCVIMIMLFMGRDKK